MSEFDEFSKGTACAILEDYVVIGTPHAGALIRRDAIPQFHCAVVAAVISANMGISLAYAERRYGSSEKKTEVPDSYDIFQRAYRAAMEHVEKTIKGSSAPKIALRPLPECSLRMLPSSGLSGTFFAAGLLFRTGHLFEARAVARTILEQVAWAYIVRTVRDAKAARRIKVTGSISSLQPLLPYVGRLYGELSSESHPGLDEHYRCLELEDEYGKIILTHGVRSWSVGSSPRTRRLLVCRFRIYSNSHLHLPENWTRTQNGLELRTDRPFLDIIARLRNEDVRYPTMSFS